VPVEVRIYMTKVVDTYAAEGVSYKRDEKRNLERASEMLVMRFQSHFAAIGHVRMKDMLDSSTVC
jgi:hypothetical protein